MTVRQLKISMFHHFLLILSSVALLSAEVVPLADAVPAKIADLQDCQAPDRVHLDGMLGTRIANSEANRLLLVDIDRELDGFRHRPGRQSYDGEHIGKWLHAATLAWVNTGDARLRTKLVSAVVELMKCQLADGYLGTYLEKDRWTEWDVWAHKYNLIGIITYMRYTGDKSPLECCRKMGDLLCREFGDGKRDINAAGYHHGLAPGSVLEPMVWLYRLTGETRYRDFCAYLMRAWEQPDGPHVVSILLDQKRVDKVGEYGKAYEEMSCINGILEWYRVTGEKDLLTAALNAWEDIVAKRLYLTGAASSYECFKDDYELPNGGANVGETCVTVTWLQLNAHLLRLTGEARFAQQLERVCYNQLCGAQRPDGKTWGYYVQLMGQKPFSDVLDGHCCLSSGPRGLALIPTFAITSDAEGLVVNLYDDAKAELKLRNGEGVKLAIVTRYPAADQIDIAITPEKTQAFTVRLRIPDWCTTPSLQIAGVATELKPGADGYVAITRTWQAGDKLALRLPMTVRLIVGEHTNQDLAAIAYGPLILARDAALDPGRNPSIAATDAAGLKLQPLPASGAWKDWDGAQVFRIAVRNGTTTLAPFATAGASDGQYRVWMNLGGQGNLLEDGRESRSRAGNISGDFLQEGVVVTWDGKKQDEDWYAVELDAAATITKVVFTHGSWFKDGGWFDASAGKPKVQVQTAKGGGWTTVGELADYPATTAVDIASMKSGARSTCTLAKPMQVFGVRVVGKPACGENPEQAFSSCGGLKALEP